jgi:Protein of unknown function (DUF3224)
MSSVNGVFRVASWDEAACQESQDRRLTRASVSQAFEGGISGEGSAEWLMAYNQDGTARFVGFQVVEGELEGRRGTFVMETAGEFDGQVARWQASVLPGSQTGELQELDGGGTFEAPLGSQASYELELALPTR